MKLKELSFFEFDDYSKNHPLGSYHQTSNYALFASEQGYDYEMIAMVDEKERIHAAALIIYKKIGLFYRYGYAPKGFLLNYYNPQIIQEFSTLLKKRYYKKNFAFIKFNPEISIGQINLVKKDITYNKNKYIEQTLEDLKFKKIENNNFSLKLPKFNAVIITKKFDIKNIAKATRNKINKSIKYGMSLEKGSRENIQILYKFIKNKKQNSINHYMNYFNAFNQNNNIDVLLVKIDYEKCLINLRKEYDKEIEKNEHLVEKLINNSNDYNLKRKLASDKIIANYENKIASITQQLSKNKEEYIAGAITIKYKNRINILISGFDQKYKTLCPNHFLHYKIIQHYKKNYDFIDLNGISGNFNEANPYKGLDEFKFGFNPLVFEYIGEYDYIINEGLYKILNENGLLKKEFEHKQKTITNK